MTDNLPQTRVEFTPAQVELIKNTFAKGCNDLEFELFMNLARTYSLDPFRGQIWVVKYGTAPARVFTGRDGFLEIAHRSGQFDGMESGWREDPATKRITGFATVFRKDMGHPFVVEVLLDEYKKDTEIWREKPRTMIQKVAESQALRKAFSAFSLYAPEEFGEQEKPPMKDVTPQGPQSREMPHLLQNPVIDADAEQRSLSADLEKKFPEKEKRYVKKGKGWVPE